MIEYAKQACAVFGLASMGVVVPVVANAPVPDYEHVTTINPASAGALGTMVQTSVSQTESRLWNADGLLLVVVETHEARYRMRSFVSRPQPASDDHRAPTLKSRRPASATLKTLVFHPPTVAAESTPLFTPITGPTDASAAAALPAADGYEAKIWKVNGTTSFGHSGLSLTTTMRHAEVLRTSVTVETDPKTRTGVTRTDISAVPAVKNRQLSL